MYSSEERTMGDQTIALHEISQAPFRPVRTPAEGLTVPLHARDYYETSWYIALAVFNYLQVLLVSSSVLTGAYNTNSDGSNFYGLFGSAQDISTMFLNTMDWITLYAPVLSLIMTLPFILPVKKPAALSKSHFVLRLNQKFSRVKIVLVLPFAGLISFVSLINRGVPFPGQGISALSQGIIAAVLFVVPFMYLPWYYVISLKLKREGND